MLKICRLFGVVLMLYGTVAVAQSPSAETGPAKPAAASEYWLGVGCLPVPPTVRAQMQLPEKQGLLVVGVLPESPAAKAGIALHDVLLRAGDKPLAVPQDLVQILDAGKGAKLKIDLIHNGKPKTVEAVPIQRPAEARHPAMGLPAPDDWQTMMNWLEGIRKGGEPNGAQPPMRFRLIHPGAIVPQEAAVPPPLPADMSIVVSKAGDRPAKITVKQGDRKWEITEKELDKLPADVRPHVERMLGRGSLDIIGALGAMDAASEADQAGATVIPSHDAALIERMEKQFDEMNRRLDKLVKEVELLRQGQQPSPKSP